MLKTLLALSAVLLFVGTAFGGDPCHPPACEESSLRRRALQRRAIVNLPFQHAATVDFTDFVNVKVDKDVKKAVFDGSIRAGATVEYAYLVCNLHDNKAFNSITYDGTNVALGARIDDNTFIDVTARVQANPSGSGVPMTFSYGGGVFWGCVGKAYFTVAGNAERRAVVYWGNRETNGKIPSQTIPIDTNAQGRTGDVRVVLDTIWANIGQSEGDIYINGVIQPHYTWDENNRNCKFCDWQEYNGGPLTGASSVTVETKTAWEDWISWTSISVDYLFAASRDKCDDAMDACNFAMEYSTPIDVSGTPDKPVVKIVSKDPVIELFEANSNALPKFIDSATGAESYVKDEAYGGHSLRYFQFGIYNENNRAFIGFETFEGEPQSAAIEGASGRCVKVFLTQYQYTENGEIKNANDVNECVVFRTSA